MCARAPCTGWSCSPQAALCESIEECQGFALNSQVSSWTLVPELFGVATPDPTRPGPGWTQWQRIQPAPPLPPWNGAFRQTLDLPTATVTIETKELTVRVYINATSPVLRITAIPSANATNSTFSVKAALEPYRKHQRTTLGRGFCSPRYEQPDTVVATPPPGPLEHAVVWYHWNGQHGNATYFNDTMAGQNMPLDDPDLPDMFFHRAFGGAIIGLTRDPTDPTVVAGTGLSSLNLATVLHVDQVREESPHLCVAHSACRYMYQCALRQECTPIQR